MTSGLSHNYYKAFAPRIGLAWSPTGSGKTSVRAGFGIFYNPVEQLVYKQFNGAPPFGAAPFLTNILYNTPYEHQNGSIAVNPFPLNNEPPFGQPVDWSIFRPTSLFGQQNPDRRPQMAEQYNLTLQHQFAHDIVVQIGYVGSEGHFLTINHDLNPGTAQTCLDLNLIPGQSCGPFAADNKFFIPANAIPNEVHTASAVWIGPKRHRAKPTSPSRWLACGSTLRPCVSQHAASAALRMGNRYLVFTRPDNIGNSNYNSLQISAEKRAAKRPRSPGRIHIQQVR